MASIRILVGSVYGGALLTARTLKKTLEPEGHRITVLEEPGLEDINGNDEPLLVCTSTTGQGELPPICCRSTFDCASNCPSNRHVHLGSLCLVTAPTVTPFVVPVS